MEAPTAPARRIAVLTQQLTAPSGPCPAAAQQPPPPALARAATAAPTGDGRLFAGKVVVITGAAKGIGAAAARQFAAQGARLVLTDLDQAAVDGVAAECRQLGGDAVSLGGDVTAVGAAGRIVGAARDAFGRIDVLVNNAGFTWDGVIHRMSDKQWQTMLDVHVTAPFKLVQAAAPLMRDAAKAEAEAGGDEGSAAPRAIINISSVSGTHGNGGQANYASAKMGVVGLTKTVAKEWGPFNIRCNAIAYGMIDTRLTRNKGDEVIQVGGEKVALGIPGADSMRGMAAAMVPLQRIGSAEEAAGAILFLASPWSTYITGQVLEVNGGSYM